jgi:hypothetical protein
MKWRSNLIFAGKMVIGLGLIAALLLIDNNWKKVLDIAADMRPAYLIPFFAITLFLTGVSCIKWRLFLSERDVHIPLHKLMSMYFIGTFFNNFFPSSFGGDVVRSSLLGNNIGSQGRALASVFLERFTGFIAMVSLAIFAFIFSPFLHDEKLIFWSIIIMSSGTVGVLIVLWKPVFIEWVFYPFRQLSLVEKLKEKAYQFHGHVVVFHDKPKILFKAMIYSFIFYGLAAINVYLSGLLLDIHADLSQLFVITPIVMLLAALSITPNGLGVWEWGFSVFLVSAGVANEQGLAIALALRGKNILVSMFGGLLFLFRTGPEDRKEITGYEENVEPEVQEGTLKSP